MDMRWWPSFTNVSFLTVNDRDATLSADAKNGAMAMRYSVRNANVAPNQDVRGSSEVWGMFEELSPGRV